MEVTIEVIADTDVRSLAQFAAVINQSFPVLEGGAFYDDFPVWQPSFSVGGVARLGAFVERAGGTRDCVGTAGLRLASLRTPTGGGLPIALIGAVSTDPSVRGQGVASALAEQAASLAAEKGAALTLLWGSEHSLYGRLGFELCGSQILVPLKGTGLVAKPSGAVGTGWTSGIGKLMSNRPDGLVVTPEDLVWIEAHRHVSWYWLGDPEDPVAYAAVGRGMDLQGVVHEWGGERSPLLSLLMHVEAKHPEAMLLGPADLFARTGLAAARCESGFLALARVERAEAIWKAFRTDAWPGLKSAAELFNVAVGQERALVPLWIWGLDAA